MEQKTLRIVHCFRSPIGGVFRHVRDLVAAQKAAGHQVGIVCELREDGALEQALFAELEPQLALGLHRIAISRHIGISDLLSITAVYRRFKQLQPDIVHGHGAKGGTYARIPGTFARLHNHKNHKRPARFYSPHGGSLHHDKASLSGKIMFQAERWQEYLSDGLIFVSAYEQQTYYAKIGKPRCPTALIYNGLQPQEFAPVALQPEAADFIFIGMMRDLKGPDLFIQAIAQLHKVAPQCSAVMIGDGPDKPRYQTMVQELGLQDHIRFHEAMPMRQALTLGNVLVIPSRAESLPYIVLETLAAERPVIATNVGGMVEILGKDSPALCSVNAPAITVKMMEALQAPQTYAAQMPSLPTIREKFSLCTMADAIETEYYRAIT